MNKSVILRFKQAIPASCMNRSWNSRFFIKTGAGVILFGIGVESDSKNLDSDHLCPKHEILNTPFLFV